MTTNEKTMAPHRAWELVQAGGTTLIDVRSPQDYAHGHPLGALSLPFSARGLRERLASLAPGETRVILVAGDAEQASGALKQIGDRAVGVLADGVTSWSAAGLPVRSLPEASVQTVAPDRRPDDVTVLDVREPIEWEMGHVPGALLISLGEVAKRIDEVPRTGRVAVICESGIRSSMAAGLLLAAGYDNVVHVIAGTSGYRNAGLPLEYAASAT